VSDLGLPTAIDELFGWTLREGVTNVLRHSAARACWISIRCDDGKVRLEIENDEAASPAVGGNGLVGLASRTAELLGTAVRRPTAGGRFRLVVEVPVPAAMREVVA
jgi:two-component system sensor histidine kinase DesK